MSLTPTSQLIWVVVFEGNYLMLEFCIRQIYKCVTPPPYTVHVLMKPEHERGVELVLMPRGDSMIFPVTVVSTNQLTTELCGLVLYAKQRNAGLIFQTENHLWHTNLSFVRLLRQIHLQQCSFQHRVLLQSKTCENHTEGPLYHLGIAVHSRYVFVLPLSGLTISLVPDYAKDILASSSSSSPPRAHVWSPPRSPSRSVTPTRRSRSIRTVLLYPFYARPLISFNTHTSGRLRHDRRSWWCCWCCCKFSKTKSLVSVGTTFQYLIDEKYEDWNSLPLLCRRGSKN